MFKRLLLFLMAALMSSAAHAGPKVVRDTKAASELRYNVYFDATTTASELMPVRGLCAATYILAGSEVITLYQTTASTATGGTAVATFSATSTSPTDITYGQPNLYAVSTGATAGGALTIHCSPTQVGSTSRSQPVFYAESYGGNTLAAINAALAACDTWAQANNARGTVKLPRGKTTIVASTSTSPLISLPEHVTIDSVLQYNSSCDLDGWGSVKNYNGGGLLDPVGSSLVVWYPALMTATDGYKAVIFAPGHNQKISNFNIVLTGDNGTHVDGAVAILAASSSAGSRTFGANGIKHSQIDNVVLQSAHNGYGIGFASIFWLDNSLTNSWFDGFQYGYRPVSQASTANNANFIAGNAFKTNNVGIYIDDGLACQDMYLHRNTIEANAYGIRMTSTGSCRINTYGTHWEQDVDGTQVGVNDVLIEGASGTLSSFGDFFDSDIAVGAHVVRTVAQGASINWDVIEGGNFRTNTDRPYSYAAGAGIRVNGSAPNIVTTTGTATAKMKGEVHIADHATATSDVDYTLPSAFAGMTGCFYDNGGGDGGIIVDAAAADEILLYGAGVGVADAIDSPGVAGAGANGDFICLQAIDDTYWITLGGSGTWVDGGVD